MEVGNKQDSLWLGCSNVVYKRPVRQVKINADVCFFLFLFFSAKETGSSSEKNKQTINRPLLGAPTKEPDFKRKDDLISSSRKNSSRKQNEIKIQEDCSTVYQREG